MAVETVARFQRISGSFAGQSGSLYGLCLDFGHCAFHLGCLPPDLFLPGCHLGMGIRPVGAPNHFITCQSVSFSGVFPGFFSCFYTVTTYIPKVVRGENETVQVARWASYMMENPRLQSSLPEWIRQVESTAWNDWIFRWSPYQVERYWTIYNQKGELVADSTYPFLKEALISQAAHHEEKAFIREVLKTQKMISIPLKSGSRYMTAAPIYGHDGQILGVVNQMIRFDDFFYVDAVVLTMFFSFLLSIPLILLTVLLAFVIALPFSYLHARFVTRRVVQVGEAAKAWSRGDLAFRIRDEQIDELGILSRQLNQLAGSLEETTQKLHNEKRQVESLLRSKQEFVANVSHELRNPLAIIQGYVEQLHMHDPWKETKEVQILKREVTRLQRMIDDLFVIATEDEKNRLLLFYSRKQRRWPDSSNKVMKLFPGSHGKAKK